MNLNEILNFRTGNKFIVTEDYTNKIGRLWNGSKYNPTKNSVYLPKGLVFTIVSTTLNAQTQCLRCKIIRSKKIIESIYKPNNIDSIFYTGYRWNNDLDENAFVRLVLRGEGLVAFINTVKTENFTEEYNKLTKYEK